MMKNTKSALVMSVVSIIVCCTMLLGTTMAWFTDSVTSAKNVIVAGNLDVELYHEGNKVDANYSVFPETGAFLWEPGAVIYENLEIKNEGNLALKYQLTLSDLEATETPDGKTLKDVIKVGIVKGGFTATDANVDDRTEAINAVNDAWNDFDEFFAKGELLADDVATTEVEGVDVYGIVLYWEPSDVDNDYNMNNDNKGTVLNITFGINLVATQLEAEEDSFDNTYDEGAYLPVVYSAEELISALENGDSVKLGDNIELDTYVTVPAGVTVTLNLNGKTLSATSGNVIRNNGDLTVVNGTLEGTTTYTINNESVTGFVKVENVKSVNGGFFNAGSMVVTDCQITNTASGKHALVNSGDASTNLTVNGGTYSTTSGNALLYAYTGTIEVNDGDFTQIGSSYMIDGSGITINGGTFTDDDGTWAIRGTNMTINGGTFNFNPTNWVASGYEVFTVDSKYIVVAENVEIVTDAAELGDAIANAENGDVIEIMADITGDLTAEQKPGTVVTINGNGNDFAGFLVVDGKSATYTTAGLVIKDVNFVADSISADACIRLGDGTDATRYTCNVTIENCTFDVPGAVGVKSYTGGDKNITIRNCTATARAHSLVQLKGIDGVLVQDCKVYSKNGLNFNNSTNVTVDYCTVDVKGYAVRFGESSGGVGAAEVYEIKNSTLKSACDDDDAVIVLRGTADYSTLTIKNTTIEGAIEITNTATGATVVR